MELQEVKASVETLGRAFEEYKHTLAKTAKDGDVLIEQKLDKIASEIGAKLEAVQKHNDEIAAKMARPAVGNGADEQKRLEMARTFRKEAQIVQKRYNPEIEIVGDLSELDRYEKSFAIRLRRDDARLTAEEFKALSVGSDPDGGYLAPPTMSSRIITNVYETSPMRGLATVETISTDSMEFPVDTDEASAGWVGETTTRTETDTPQIAKHVIPIHEVYAEPKASTKMLEDAAVDIERWLVRKVSEKIARVQNTAFVSGNGIGKPRGFTTYTAGTAWGQVEQIATGAAAALTGDGIIGLISAVKEPYLPNAHFGMKRASIGNVMKLKQNSTGTGDYIFTTIFSEGIPRAFLAGYPVRFLNDMDAVGAGLLPLAFGDFAAAYTIVERIGISVLRDPFTTKGFVKFYTKARVGGGIVNFEAIKLQKCATS